MKIALKKVNIWLVHLTLFGLQAYLIRFHIGPYPSNLQEVLIGLTLAVFGLRILSEKKFGNTISHFLKNRILITLVILTGLSIFTREIIQKEDYLRHIKFLFFAITFVFVFLETIDTKEGRKTALSVASAGALCFGLFSLIYNLLGHNVGFDQRLRGPLDSAVYMAYYLTPFFIISASHLIENTSKIRKIEFAQAVILGSLILATRSMGAIAGSFLILTFFLFKKKSDQIFKYRYAKITLTTIAILITAAIFYTKVLPTINTTYSSFDERGEIWQTSLHLLKEPMNVLFGTGIGQFEYHYIENVQSVINRTPLEFAILQPHNIFLLFIFEFGILGLFFLLMIIFQTSKKLLDISPLKETSLAEISALALSYFLLHGLIDTPFFKNDTLILLILFINLAIPQLHTKKAKK